MASERAAPAAPFLVLSPLGQHGPPTSDPATWMVLVSASDLVGGGKDFSDKVGWRAGTCCPREAAREVISEGNMGRFTGARLGPGPTHRGDPWELMV